MTTRLVQTIATLAVLVFGAASAMAQTDADFARANDEFAKGKFQDAIRDYESLVHAGQWSAPLFYDLGNAYFRTGDLGRAILNYERALALDPQHPEAAANLALVRDDARALDLQRSRLDGWLKHVTANQAAIAAAIGFWLAVSVATVMLARRSRSAIALLLVLLGCAVAILAGVAAYRIQDWREKLAIVTAPEVRARLATADNASSVLQLPPGSEVQVLSRRGAWIYALLPNNQRGWIQSGNVEQVRL